MRTRRYTWQAIVIAVAVTAVHWSQPATAHALTAAEVAKRIDRVRSQLGSVSDRLENAGIRMAESNRAAAVHRKALAEAESDRARLRTLISGRAAQLYMLGADAQIAVGADLVDLADSISYLEEVNLGSQALLEEVRALEARADTESVALAAALARAREARDELAAHRREVGLRLRELQQLHEFLVSVDPRAGERASRGRIRGMWCPVIGPSAVSNNWGAPRGGGPHTGVDIDAAHGQGVRAVLPGTVVDTPTGGWIGIGIILRDLAGNEWWYAHLSSRSVRRGERVSGGEFMGRVGCTGTCYGSHLHFEYHPGGGGPANPYRIASSVC